VLFRVLVGAVVDSGVPIADGSREFPSEFRDLREQCALRLRAELGRFLVVGKKELPADEDSGRLLQETEYEGTGKIEAVLNFFCRWKTEQQRKKKSQRREREKEREGERRKSRVLSLVGV
jgi:hypothetical protein